MFCFARRQIINNTLWNIFICYRSWVLYKNLYYHTLADNQTLMQTLFNATLLELESDFYYKIAAFNNNILRRDQENSTYKTYNSNNNNKTL